MSWNIHHTTILSVAIGYAPSVLKQGLSSTFNTSTSTDASLHNNNFNSTLFKTAFVGLNIASAIYDFMPTQKTVIETKMVKTTDSEGNIYEIEDSEQKQYSVNSLKFDSLIKLEMGLLSMLLPGDMGVAASVIVSNSAQLLSDLSGFSDCCESITAHEINGDHSFLF